AAVIGLTSTAGAEWASRGVRVNAVAPGYVDTGGHRGIEDLTWDEWSAVVDVNLHGVFSALQAAGKRMLDRGEGRIVNISSISSRGSAGRAPYATTKAAVIGLTSTAGAEWASRGVRVNAVAPGYVDTG
ncbi:hypothetical protein CTI14_47920, partial [Methylobacterium radiotolerans]